MSNMFLLCVRNPILLLPFLPNPPSSPLLLLFHSIYFADMEEKCIPGEIRSSGVIDRVTQQESQIFSSLFILPWLCVFFFLTSPLPPALQSGHEKWPGTDCLHMSSCFVGHSTTLGIFCTSSMYIVYDLRHVHHVISPKMVDWSTCFC